MGQYCAHRILVINLMSVPGSGKTALLEATIDALKEEFRITVIEGDLETENDAERIRAKGVTAVQITTGTACHLDAYTVHGALHAMSLDEVDILFIENVGNLVCPVSFDLGQHRNVILLSVTKGDDKPAKYPVMFRAADLLLITKTDLLPVLDDFSTVRAEQCLRIWQALRRCSSCRRASTLASRRGCSGCAANFQRNVHAAPLPRGSCGLRHGNHGSWVVGTSARCTYNRRVGTQTQK